MPEKGNGGSISVLNPSGASLIVTITSGTATPTAYTTAALSATHTMPLTITDDETFWFADASDYTVSVTQNGSEIANGRGGTKTIPLIGGCGVGFTPSPEFGASIVDLSSLDADNIDAGTVAEDYLPNTGPIALIPIEEEPTLSLQTDTPHTVASVGQWIVVWEKDGITGDALPAGAIVSGPLTLSAAHAYSVITDTAGFFYIEVSVAFEVPAGGATVCIAAPGSTARNMTLPEFATYVESFGMIIPAAADLDMQGVKIQNLDGDDITVTDVQLAFWPLFRYEA